jgi:acetylornithine deacetylase/succinyl-diaminopimelate desuccinylase-like protein
MRLVPNQEPDKIEKLFTAYINKIAPKSVKVNTYGLHHGKAAVTPIDSKWIKAAFDALKQGFGKEPVFIREGGSIPIVVTFKEVLGADTVLLGFGLPDENAHSPDEHLNLNNFHKIITTSIFIKNYSKLICSQKQKLSRKNSIKLGSKQKKDLSFPLNKENFTIISVGIY